MADRIRIETAAGMLPEPQEIQTDQQGRLTESSVAALSAFMKGVAQALNGRLSLGDGVQSAQSGNIDGQNVTWTFAVANQEYEIPHGLGRVPVGVLPVQLDRAGIVYMSNAGGWGINHIFLKSNTAGLVARLILF